MPAAPLLLVARWGMPYQLTVTVHPQNHPSFLCFFSDGFQTLPYRPLVNWRVQISPLVLLLGTRKIRARHLEVSLGPRGPYQSAVP